METTNHLGILVTRIRDGKFMHVNKTYADFHGYCLDEMIGKTVFQLNTWGSEDQRTNVIHQLKEEGTISQMPIKARLKNGEIRECLLSAELFDIDGEKYTIGLIQDYYL